MKIIDAHIHLSHIHSFHQTAKTFSHLTYSFERLKKDMKDNHVVAAVGMGLRELEGGEGFPDKDVPTPMGLDMLQGKGQVVYCAGINPYRLGYRELDALEKELLKPEVTGIKIYLGYYPFFAYDRVYEPVYDLAAKYRLPIVFHTGDTYSERGILKYAHPLTIDEVAVTHRQVTFVMAHFGDPWMLDAAEVVYKNANVFADLSGLIVGDSREVSRVAGTPHFFDHLKHGLAFCDNYEKLMFGTDWPLVEMAPYIRFIESYIPFSKREHVFYKTALQVFPKIRTALLLR
ncbi:amidohydrolase family protein [Salipaludibacillus agaradhaerens]|uniref:Amidohydrolase family protein n=1 Tax=Salipaludibacillus agaradhaerens TaxID=76935 RepID=A0A9Q4B1B3_SALAG|nr:amidohydrolase family protein [Salipaludibacillus agaradhaerens]MCR6096207.1 amidohydrolase family protein [Salipaludibacillus agaradhaerens]MCR6114234.1 amidohydrolase family protein [Salipaludibacillus agaradhaerens]